MPAMIWLFVNASVNKHDHLQSNGYIITHAHPFTKTPSESGPVKSHHHSDSELLFLSIISDPATTVITFFFLVFTCCALPLIFNLGLYNSLPVKEYYQVHHYHAPPF
jgi:hypothetical protein